MEQITIERDNLPDLRFTGERIAHATSQTPERSRARWTVLDLYRTESGKWVCHQRGLTMMQGETDRFSACIADNDHELVRQVGFGPLAKELYFEAGIECVEDLS